MSFSWISLETRIVECLIAAKIFTIIYMPHWNDNHCLCSLFHTITVPWESQDANKDSSQLKQTSRTGAQCPWSLFTQFLLSRSTSKKYTVASSLPVTVRKFFFVLICICRWTVNIFFSRVSSFSICLLLLRAGLGQLEK